jgi:hypothetical protein
VAKKYPSQLEVFLFLPRPQQQHGFVINLFQEDKAILSVDAGGNALFWRSLDDAFNHTRQHISEDEGFLKMQNKLVLL